MIQRHHCRCAPTLLRRQHGFENTWYEWRHRRAIRGTGFQPVLSISQAQQRPHFATAARIAHFRATRCA